MVSNSSSNNISFNWALNFHICRELLSMFFNYFVDFIFQDFDVIENCSHYLILSWFVRVKLSAAFYIAFNKLNLSWKKLFLRVKKIPGDQSFKSCKKYLSDVSFRDHFLKQRSFLFSEYIFLMTFMHTVIISY